MATSKTCRCAYLDQLSFVDCMGPISDVLKRAAAHDVRAEDLVEHHCSPCMQVLTTAPSPLPLSPQVRAEDLVEHRILGMGTFGKVRCPR